MRARVCLRERGGERERVRVRECAHKNVHACKFKCKHWFACVRLFVCVFVCVSVWVYVWVCKKSASFVNV